MALAPTIYTAAQAVSRAYSWTSYPVGMCLNFVWKCLNYPVASGLYDANAAWAAATMKRYTTSPPAGAPVYFAGGAHGHVAISLGGGKIRSTDWPEKGRVGNTTISYLATRWGQRYRGWSADYAGHPIRNLGGTVTYPPVMAVDKTTVIYASDLRPEKRNANVARFEKALYNYLGGPYRLKIAASKGAVGDGYYGTLTKTMCSDAYAKAGMTRATYPAGTQLLKVLGFTNAKVSR
jgi:hypothetical protein